MLAKQLSVFIENRQGRLGEVLNVLKDKKVNILSISLADTTEYGLLRLIVNDANLGKEELKKAGFSTMLSDVLIIKISHETGSLQKIVELLTKNGISIEYMYGLSIKGNFAYIAIKTSDQPKADNILSENGLELISEKEIKSL